MCVHDDAIDFRLTQAQDAIALETNLQIIPGDDYYITTKVKTTLITSRKHAAVDDRLTVRFQASRARDQGSVS